jgi:hypothetical protein
VVSVVGLTPHAQARCVWSFDQREMTRESRASCMVRVWVPDSLPGALVLRRPLLRAVCRCVRG